MKSNKFKNLSESDQNFLDRMHSQNSGPLTEKDKKVVEERWKKIEEYGNDIMEISTTNSIK